MSRLPISEARLDQVVLAAAELDTHERTAYLARLSHDHPEVIAEARRLLQAAKKVSDSFLGQPVVDLLEDDLGEVGRAESPGEPLQTPVSPDERYTLGPRLGRGGMAEVYRAHDHQLDRPVALKLLSHSDPATLSRCLREARTQARVRHRHVLEVYDTGELDGRPFIALRLVEGATLGELAERSSLEELIALSIQVAEGLDAAHQMGLVHRDVKPSNVLVEERDGELTAFVGDFGIAAPVVDSARASGLAGTIPYLAPERLEPGARPDRRSDVWSFGVMLYQLLTGELPFEGAEIFGRLQSIREARPVAPRDRLPALPADLEAIVLKCLRKDPADRYPTARAVAQDLKRYLRGEVVEAHAAGLAYRATRFVLRHRGWVRLATALSTLLLASLVVAAVLGWRAHLAEGRATLRQGQAENLIGFMLHDLRDKLDRLGRLELIDDVGNEALRYFAAVPAEELSDEELARYGTALHQIGEVRLRQGRAQAAVEAFGQSLALSRTSRERDRDNPERLFELGQSHFWVGYGLRELGDLDGARASFESYLWVSEELATAESENPRWLAELGYAHSNLGTLHQDRGELDRAIERFVASLEAKEQLDRLMPDDLDLRRDLAWAHNALGVALQWRGDSQEARSHFDRELEIRRTLVAASPGDARWRTDLAVTLNYVGGWLLQHGQWSAAVQPFEEAQAIHRVLVADDPSNRKRRQQAINGIALARAWIGLERPGQAIELLEEARRLVEPNGEEPGLFSDRRELASAHLHLARALAALGESSVAAAHIERAVELFEALESEQPESRVVLQRLGLAQLVRGDLEWTAGRETEARSWWLAAIESAHPSPSPATATTAVAQHPYSKGLWGLAKLRLGDEAAASSVRERLARSGFCDADLGELCDPKLFGEGDQALGSGR